MSGERRHRISVAQMMGLIALIAVACRWPAVFILVLPLVAYYSTPLGLPKALAPVLLAVYAPCLIGFASDCDHCRKTWSTLWPVVPGGVVWLWVHRFLNLPPVPELAAYAISAIVTLAIIGVATAVAALGRRALWATTLVLAMLSSICASLLSTALRA